MKIQIFFTFFAICILQYYVRCAPILIKNEFPQIEIHEHELQRYNMAKYFFGTPIQYELLTPGIDDKIYFREATQICEVNFPFNSLLSFILDPLSDDMPQILLSITTNFVLTRLKLIDTCKPQYLTYNLTEIFPDLRGYLPISLFAFYQDASIFHILVEITNNTSEDNPHYIALIQWGLEEEAKPIYKTIEYAGPLSGVTMIEYGGMLFTYKKCWELNECDDDFMDNSVYGYVLRLEKGVWDMHPYLIANLNKEFFGVKKLIIREVAQYNNSLLIVDSANNAVYQVHISSEDRIPIWERTFRFITKVDSISVPKPDSNLFYISGRLGLGANAEILEIKNNTLRDIFYDHSKPINITAQDNADVVIHNYRIMKTCNTQNFHFSHIRSTKNNSQHWIRIASIDEQYYDLLMIYDINLFDCFLYRYDYILIGTPYGYTLYKYRLPELIIDYSNFNEPTNNLREPYNITLMFKAKSSTEYRKISRNMTIYPWYDIYPMQYAPFNQTFSLYNFKGMFRSMDLSTMFAGLISTLYVKPLNSLLEKYITIEPKWLQVEGIFLDDPLNSERYQKIIEAARDESLVFATSNEKIYAFPFTTSTVKQLEKMSVFCFDITINRQNKKTMTDCTDRPKVELLMKAQMHQIVGPVVKITNLHYATIHKDDNIPANYFLNVYEYDPDTEKTCVLKKIVTDAFNEGEEVQSVIFNAGGNPKTLIVYGKRGMNGFFQIFNVNCEKGKFGIKKVKHETTNSQILKGGFLLEMNAAIFLNSNSTRTFLYVYAFAELHMKSNIIPIESNVIDFYTFKNHIIAITDVGRIFQMTLDYPEVYFTREIVLPTNSFLVFDSENTKPIAVLDEEMIGNRLFIYFLIYSPMIQDSSYHIFAYDLLENSHKAPFMVIPLEGDLGKPGLELIGLYSTKYKNEALVMLVTNQYIHPFLVRDKIELTLNSQHNYNFNKEIIQVKSNEANYLSFNFELSEYPTAYTTTQNAKNDRIVSLFDELILSLDTYIHGYGVNYTTNYDSGCYTELTKPFNEFAKIEYGISEDFNLLLTNNKLFIYSIRNMLYYYELDYDSKKDSDIIPAPRYIHYLGSDIVPQGIKILYKSEDEFYCGILGYNSNKQLPTLSIFNKTVSLIYETQVGSLQNTLLVGNNELGLFVYINILPNSLEGKVLSVNNNEVLSYEFNTYDAGGDPFKPIDCSISKVSPFLYCIDIFGNIYSIRLFSERAVLMYVTPISTQIRKYMFSAVNVPVQGARIHATHANELLIFSQMGVIRCNCGTIEAPEINCLRNSNNDQSLNIIPSYQNYTFTNVWATDSKVMVNIAMKNISTPYGINSSYVIRIINGISPFEDTEIIDIPYKHADKITSMAINSTAFGSVGILFAEVRGIGIKAFKFTLDQLMIVKPTKNKCTINVTARNMEGNTKWILIEIITLEKLNVNISVIFGGFNTTLGLSGIVILTLYYKKRDAKRKKKKEESDKASEDSFENNERDIRKSIINTEEINKNIALDTSSNINESDYERRNKTTKSAYRVNSFLKEELKE